MKQIITEVLAGFCLVLALAGFLLSNVENARASEPELVARVNGEPVTRDELQRMPADPLTYSQIQQGPGVQGPDTKEPDRLALRKLIHRRLILQEARRRNLTVNEQDVDKALAALRRQFGELRDFGVWMKEQGLDDKNLFEMLRTEMLMNRVLAALVDGVRVTEDQVKAYYEAHKEDLKTAGDVRLRIIAVNDKKTAEEIMADLEKGGHFAALARERSNGIRAAQGGDTGWVDPLKLPPPLREAVGALKVGDAGGPVQKGNEFMIVRLVGQRPERMKNPTEARPEIERRLLASKQQEAVQTWLADQEKKAKIEVFAQETGQVDGRIK